MIKNFKCQNVEYSLSSASSDAKKTHSPNLRQTKLTLCRSAAANDAYILWSINDTVYVSRADPDFGKDLPKALVFTSRPTSHAFLSSRVASDTGPDLLVGFADGAVALLNLKANLNSVTSKPTILSTLPPPSVGGSVDQEKEQSKCTSVHWVVRQDQYFILAIINSTCYVFRKSLAPDPIARESGKGSTSIFSLRSTPTPSEKITQPAPYGLFTIAGDGVQDSQLSPDGKMLCVGCKDGTLRVLDISDILCPVTIGGFSSFYGGVLCCAWSGDSRYVAAGSEDDLVTVYGVAEQCPVAHCEGHRSWVSGIAFDNGSVAKGFARLISVGQDAHISFWDIEVGEAAEVSPSSPPTQSTMRKAGSQVSLQQLGWQGQETAAALSGESPKGNSVDLKFKRPEGHLGSAPVVGSVKRTDMILYAPLALKRIHPDPISSCLLADGLLITADCQGLVKVWTKQALISI